jgi:pSer/pThr/pTyr-binding forkhead associated (FHA) protein
MGVSLVLCQEDGKSKEVSLPKPVVIVGRQTDCTIRIPSSSVSRHHCEVRVEGGVPRVKDLGSSNGTYVNRRRVNETELAPGDLLCVGGFVFLVRVDGKPAAFEPDECFEDGIVEVKPVGPGAAAARPAGSGQGSGSSSGAAGPGAGGKPGAGKAGAGKAGTGQSGVGRAANEGSSVADFDFLDEDEDIKKQPKL